RAARPAGTDRAFVRRGLAADRARLPPEPHGVRNRAAFSRELPADRLPRGRGGDPDARHGRRLPRLLPAGALGGLRRAARTRRPPRRRRARSVAPRGAGAGSRAAGEGRAEPRQGGRRDAERTGAFGGAILKCPFCAHIEDKVVDSRESKEGDVIRRRRECLSCGRRFTSYERIDQIPHMVVKKDGRRERFDREKVMAGLLKACEKRPVSVKALEQVVDQVEAQVQESPDRELSTDRIGEVLMASLRDLDKVAFVRFASVYRDFKDVDQFMATLKRLLKARD